MVAATYCNCNSNALFQWLLFILQKDHLTWRTFPVWLISTKNGNFDWKKACCDWIEHTTWATSFTTDIVSRQKGHTCCAVLNVLFSGFTNSTLWFIEQVQTCLSRYAQSAKLECVLHIWWCSYYKYRYASVLA